MSKSSTRFSIARDNFVDVRKGVQLQCKEILMERWERCSGSQRDPDDVQRRFHKERRGVRKFHAGAHTRYAWERHVGAPRYFMVVLNVDLGTTCMEDTDDLEQILDRSRRAPESDWISRQSSSAKLYLSFYTVLGEQVTNIADRILCPRSCEGTCYTHNETALCSSLDHSFVHATIKDDKSKISRNVEDGRMQTVEKRNTSGFQEECDRERGCENKHDSRIDTEIDGRHSEGHQLLHKSNVEMSRKQGSPNNRERKAE